MSRTAIPGIADFYREEFACPCCGDDRMSPRVIEALQVARQHLGRAIRLTSAVRCPEYNRKVGGSLTSSHLVILRDGLDEACAVDIMITSAHHAFLLVNVLERAGFDRFGIRSHGDKRFIHTDLDIEKVANVLWTYA